MKRSLPAASLVVLLLSCCLGCTQDERARMLLSPSPLQADQDLKALPGLTTAETLQRTSRIDLHSRMEMPDKAAVDVWVIQARDAAGKPVRPAAATILILHSYGTGKGSYPFWGAGERLARRGYDVVLPDLRRHGYSTGEYTTFGAKEKDDLKRVMDQFLAEKAVSDRVYVFGAGLGACVGIQYAAIDPRVAGVVAIAPYKDFRSFARQRYPLMGEAEFLRLVEAAGKMGGFQPEEASAVEAARKLSCPLLLMHGILDFTVPPEWCQAILDAAQGPKKLQVVSVETAMVVALYEDWLTDQVDSFVRNGLKDAPAQTQPAAATQPAGNG